MKLAPLPGKLPGKFKSILAALAAPLRGGKFGGKFDSRGAIEMVAASSASANDSHAVEREATECDLDAACADLADDELRVVAHLARRLLEGQRRYGRLSLATDRRTWRRERAEEIADLLMYSAFEALKGDT